MFLLLVILHDCGTRIVLIVINRVIIVYSWRKHKVVLHIPLTPSILLHYATIYMPYTAISLYPSSFIGDLFNGMVAQAFNRTSTFGGLLDMVTDRCTTLGLIFILYREYGDTDKLDLENHMHRYLSMREQDQRV